MTWLSEVLAASEEGGSPRHRPAHAPRVLRGSVATQAQTAPLSVEVPEWRLDRDGPSVETRATDRRKGISIEERLEAVRREAYEAGFRDGVESTERAAEAEVKSLNQRAVEAFRQAAGAMSAGRTSALAVAQRDAAELAFELTRALVGHELSVAANPGVDAVARALELSSPDTPVVVRLHPDDLVDASVLQPLVPDVEISVVGDPTVERGGCVMSAGPTRIDAQIQPALDRVRQILLGGIASAADADEAGEPS